MWNGLEKRIATDAGQYDWSDAVQDENVGTWDMLGRVVVQEIKWTVFEILSLSYHSRHVLDVSNALVLTDES